MMHNKHYSIALHHVVQCHVMLHLMDLFFVHCIVFRFMSVVSHFLCIIVYLIVS